MKLLKSLLAVIVMLSMISCLSNDTVDQDEETVADSLEMDFGGFNFNDELPYFDDPDIQSLVEDEFVVTGDEIGLDLNSTQLKVESDESVYGIVIFWGMLTGPVAGAPFLIWDGGMKLSNGLFVYRRPVLFEKWQDRLLDNAGSDFLKWRSRTLPHFDGIAALTVAKDDCELRFETESYTGMVKLKDIDRKTLVDLLGGPGGPAVAVRAVRITEDSKSGFIVGHWKRFRNRELGRFKGLWVDAAGRIVGAMKGIFGQRRDGKKLFFGKWISVGGIFRGILMGGYENGQFKGKWINRLRNKEGTLDGAYLNGYRGFYLGAFHTLSDPSSNTVNSEDSRNNIGD